MTGSRRTVLLDLYGTLVNSAPGIIASCRVALRSLGHELPSTVALATLIGPPIDEVMRLLLAPHGDDRVAAAVAAYRAEYQRDGVFRSEAYPGIPDALRALGEGGAQLFLATSKRTEFARLILDRLGLTHYFTAIHGSEPGGALDEKPALIGHILARHDIPADRCTMVGDRRHDIAGAHANQVRAAGVLWGYGPRAELEEAGAEMLLAEPAALAPAFQPG